MTKSEYEAITLSVLKDTQERLRDAQTDIAWLEHKRLLLIPYLRLAAGKARSFIVSQIEELDNMIAALYAVLSCINHPSNKYYVNKTPAK